MLKSLSTMDARPRLAISACPGLFRIVPARDGGICRIKIPLGQLGSRQAHDIADTAERLGRGVIDITNRANLQIRGIPPEGEGSVTDGLLNAGLGPIRPDSDDIRNVMVSPTAGIDPGQVMDTQPLAHALLNYIQADQSCRALSPKFCFLLDGGEGVAVVDHPHDIWLASIDGGRMAIGFAGCPPTDASDPPAVGTVCVADAVDVIVAAIAQFQESAAGDPTITRLRHLFAAQPPGAFFERLAARLGSRLTRGDITGWRRRSPRRLGHVGVGGQRKDGLSYVGAVPPLGRLSPTMLSGAAAIADQYGCGDLRLTPWQSLLVPSIGNEHADQATRALEALGFVCDGHAPLASMIACTGATGCSAGLSDTKLDARALALTLSTTSSRTVHFSGCAKSCASAGVADVTLVASAPGLYDIYRKAGLRRGRFGTMIARGATIEEATRLLSGNAGTTDDA
jgi:precorrin-3B synthase